MRAEIIEMIVDLISNIYQCCNHFILLGSIRFENRKLFHLPKFALASSKTTTTRNAIMQICVFEDIFVN